MGEWGELIGALPPQRRAACLDTAHAYAAGHDLNSTEGREELIRQVDVALGYRGEAEEASHRRCATYARVAAASRALSCTRSRAGGRWKKNDPLARTTAATMSHQNTVKFTPRSSR